jgi:hypothetical protein
MMEAIIVRAEAGDMMIDNVFVVKRRSRKPPELEVQVRLLARTIAAA